jgi:hypothetical protein
MDPPVKPGDDEESEADMLIPGIGHPKVNEGQTLPLGKPSFTPKLPHNALKASFKCPSITSFYPYLPLAKSGDRSTLSPPAFMEIE